MPEVLNVQYATAKKQQSSADVLSPMLATKVRMFFFSLNLSAIVANYL